MHPSPEIIIKNTYDPDPQVRSQAARALCPCEVKRDVSAVWNRIFELAEDPDINIRRIAYHTMIDGSPKRYETKIISALEGMRNDPNLKLRQSVRKRLARYCSTGKINFN